MAEKWRSLSWLWVPVFCSSAAALAWTREATHPLGAAFWDYFRMVGPSVAAGFLVGGVVHRFVPREYFARLLGVPKKRCIVWAALLGFLGSTCSHGILALAMELYRKGVPTAVVVTFLLASPWASLPVTILLVGLFGLKALFLVGGAIGTALVTGLLFQRLEASGSVESNPTPLIMEAGFSVREDIRQRFSSWRPSVSGMGKDMRGVWAGAVELARMTLAWVFLGIGISSLASFLLPPSFFHRAMGPTPMGMTVTLAVATVMEVCSEGTAPMAFEIYRQTTALGNAFIFLMAGVVTDYTEIGLLWANIGRRTALWLPVVTVPQVLFLGYLANLIF